MSTGLGYLGCCLPSHMMRGYEQFGAWQLPNHLLNDICVVHSYILCCRCAFISYLVCRINAAISCRYREKMQVLSISVQLSAMWSHIISSALQ